MQPRRFHVIAISAAALVLAGIAPAAAKTVCKPRVTTQYTTGVSPTKAFAQNSAITAWSFMVNTRYPAQGFTNWNNAQDRNLDCKFVTAAGGYNGYVCRAGARPCKFVL